MTINLAKFIDHTLLKPIVTKEMITKLCDEARTFQFATVCIPPCYVATVSKLLRSSGIGVTTVIGFPLGYQLTKIKKEESKKALEEGACELDMVINLCDLKNGLFSAIEEEICLIRELGFFTLKVILETAYLSEEEMHKACECAHYAGADFVKTSTGFGPSGATAKEVAFLRRCTHATMGVKASGGIVSKKQALEMIGAGATRIGTSHGVAIMSEE